MWILHALSYFPLWLGVNLFSLLTHSHRQDGCLSLLSLSPSSLGWLYPVLTLYPEMRDKNEFPCIQSQREGTGVQRGRLAPQIIG